MTGADERREVAAAMREVSSRGIKNLTLGKILNSILTGGAPVPTTEMAILAHLADLIDPITTVELRAPWTIYRKCGARMEGYQHKPVRFCPHCGSRIVR